MQKVMRMKRKLQCTTSRRCLLLLLLICFPLTTAGRLATGDNEDFLRQESEYLHRLLQKEPKVQKPNPEGPLYGFCKDEDFSCNYNHYRYTQEATSRVGLGENVGLRGIEVLGIGYNYLEGNPRGTLDSEADPGFRSRVIDLISDQNRNTPDQEYLLPYGVEFNNRFSCKFSSKSKEISNESEYQQSLATEAKQSYDSAISGVGAVKGTPVSGSAKFAFSKSENYNSFSQQSSLSQTVSYEAKAQCIERELFFKPYYKHTLDSSVKDGIETLPKAGSFDKANKKHLRLYADFIQAFGTHIVTRVALGGKHIVETKLESKDVMDLKREKVQISESLSFEASVGIGSSASDEAKDAAAAAAPPDLESIDPRGGRSALQFDAEFARNIIVYNLDKLPDRVPPPLPCEGPNGLPLPGRPAACNKPKSAEAFGFSASFGTKQSSSQESSSKQLSKIKSKVQTRNEITIGGTPPEDGNWQAWAASVPDRPVPITYELTGLWDYLPPGYDEDYIDAYFELYGIDLSAGENTNPTLEQFRFGIFDKEGLPITSYSSSSAKNYRSIVQAEQFTPERIKEKSVKLNNGECSDCKGIDDIKFCPLNYYACGITVRYDENAGTGDFWEWEGVFELKMKCCNGDDWNANIDVVVRGRDGQRRDSSSYFNEKSAICASNSYISGGQVRYSDLATTGDPGGIVGLKIQCTGPKADFKATPLDELKPENFDSELFTVLDSIDDEEERAGFESAQFAEEDKVGGTSKAPALAGLQLATVRGIGTNYNYADMGTSNEGYGIDEIKFFFEERRPGGGINHDLYTYNYVWDGSRSFVSAFFTTNIRDKICANTEDLSELGIGTEIQHGYNRPFGLVTSDEPQVATVAVFDFNDNTYTTDLSAFNILAADNNPKLGIVSGVVHPLGYLVNDIFGQQPGFILQESSRDQTMKVIFKDFVDNRSSGDFFSTNTPTVQLSEENDTSPTSMPSNSPTNFPTNTPSETPTDMPTTNVGEKIPTFLVFPLWFSTSSMPNHAGELAVAIKEKCTIDSCTVSLGTSASEVPKELGFGFLAVRSRDVPGIVHGTVNVFFDSTKKIWRAEKYAGSGFTISSRSEYSCIAEEGCEYPTNNNISAQDKTVSKGGIEIIFDDEFPPSSLPTVIVSPILNNEELNPPQRSTLSFNRLNTPDSTDRSDSFQLTSGIVESISTKSVVIKAGFIDDREECTGLVGLERRQCLNRNIDPDDKEFCEKTYFDRVSNKTPIDAGNNVTAEWKLCGAKYSKSEVDKYWTCAYGGCIEYAASGSEGSKGTTFEPLSFTFIAVGPPPLGSD